MSGTTKKEAEMDRYMVEVEWKSKDPSFQVEARERYGILVGTTINWRSRVEADDEKIKAMRADKAFTMVKIQKKL